MLLRGPESHDGSNAGRKASKQQVHPSSCKGVHHPREVNKEECRDGSLVSCELPLISDACCLRAQS